MEQSQHFYIDSQAIIGFPFRFLQGCEISSESKTDQKDHPLPSKLYIGPFSIIGNGVRFGEGVVIDDNCKVSGNVSIGQNTLVTYRSRIGGNAVIGNDCVIGGAITENAFIGDRCRIFGSLVHRHADSTMSWDFHEVPEASSKIYDDSFIGFGAVIAAGISIGPNSYVCAGTILTKDVPPLHIASGVNKIVHFEKWNGVLKNNPIFQNQ
jgi:acetyltransferase-like isoleucine patch superfamily enzyme